MYVVWAQRTFTICLLLAKTSQIATENTLTIDEETSSFNTVTRVSAVVGSEAVLPCDTRPSMRNDSLLLVVWYRDNNPVYSYDTRIQGPSAHWAEAPYRERTQWYNRPSPSLRFAEVLPRDRALYRCRVDFHVSPTRNYRVALGVIELPKKPVIFDEYGKEVTATAGPYREGDDFKLICSVNSGVPPPRIQWLQGDRVITTLSSREHHSGVVRTLTLTVRNASRELQSAVYTCTADNTLLASPQKTTVTVDMYLKPVSVEIISKEQPLSVGLKSELWCRTAGARPPASITWWLAGHKLDSITKNTGQRNHNETQSLLRWTPLKEHNGLALTCRAEHNRFNRSSIETTLPLNVYYMPEVVMKFGSNMNPHDIEEKDDVYFECIVDANPPAYKVVWEHNGVQLQNNPPNVIITGNSNLALRNVTRHHAGEYKCTASNVEGDGTSPALQLQIFYKPLCRKREVKIIGAALQEPSSVTCEVDAFPPPETFEWTLNNSGASIKVDPARFTVEAEQGRSVLTFSPVSETDYGTLSCRATNLAGAQHSPCVYTLLPATRPDQPSNCTVYNLTHDSLDLICSPGYEGGMKCTYIVEVWANDGLVANVSSRTAMWNLRKLGAARQLTIAVYAANARGRSEPVTVSVETAHRLAPRTEAQEAWEFNWAVGIFLGVACTLATIFCLALIVTRFKHRSRDYEVTLPTLKNQKVIVPKRSSFHGQDDCNPDLIPLSKATECQPQPPSYSAVVAAAARNSTSPHVPQSSAGSNTLQSSASSHNLPRLHPPPAPASMQGQYDLQTAPPKPSNSTVRVFREVVTTRTPLLAAQQESRV